MKAFLKKEAHFKSRSKISFKQIIFVKDFFHAKRKTPKYERTDIFYRRSNIDIFCELISIKEPETTLKKLLYKDIRKC